MDHPTKVIGWIVGLIATIFAILLTARGADVISDGWLLIALGFLAVGGFAGMCLGAVKAFLDGKMPCAVGGHNVSRRELFLVSGERYCSADLPTNVIPDASGGDLYAWGRPGLAWIAGQKKDPRKT